MTGSQNRESVTPGQMRSLQSGTQGGSRMPELGPYGSVRGARGNSRPYRDPRSLADKPSRPKIHLCPLWSNSGQTRARLQCPLSVESRCGAVALGRTYLLPPLSSGGALMVPPWLRFHIPLIEPDRQISRIRLSDKTSRLHFRVQRLLQFLNTHRSL